MVEAKRTLIILTPGFPANEADTTCLPFLQGHIDAISKRSPELEIIILTFQYPYVKGTYKWHDIEVFSFDGRERAKMNRLHIWWQVWKKLKQLNKEKHIIGLFSLWCTECALIGNYFGRLHKLKHFCWLCGQDAKAGNKYVKYIKPKRNELIAMSDFLRREFYKNYNIRPAHVIPLGIDPKQFSTGNFPKNIDVLGAGSLIPLKQYDIFVQVIHQLSLQTPTINATICGKGPEQTKLMSLIETLHLKDNIILTSEISHGEVLQLMQRSKIFLHTSNYEGFGLVCIEALYAGAHVVSFTKPMDIEIPHWHHVNNKEEMTNKIKSLLNDPAISFEPVCPYLSGDVAAEMMKLFQG